MRWIDRGVATLLMAAVIPLWRRAGDFPETASIFPRISLAALAALAAAMLAGTFVAAPGQGIDVEGSRDPRAVVRALVAFATALGGVLLMPRIGFFPAMLAFAAVLMPALRVENRRRYLVAIVTALICVYLFFVLLLGVPLTAWWL